MRKETVADAVNFAGFFLKKDESGKCQLRTMEVLSVFIHNKKTMGHYDCLVIKVPTGYVFYHPQCYDLSFVGKIHDSPPEAGPWRR